MHDAGNDSTKLHDLLGLGLNEPVKAASESDQPRIIASAGSDFAGFHLLERIGEGGMGVIFRAREHATERIVALKMIAERLVGLEEVRLRFKQEVRAAVALKHKHILPVYEVNEWQGVPYFSMKLAECGSLMDHLQEYLRRSPFEIAQLLVKIAHGIQHAHDQNLIHRDLKPANILLNAESEPLIADFGLARLVFDNPLPDLTTSLVVLGTPGYIAPELVQGRASKAADIYGLGAILYHLLTGRRPFEGLGGFQSLAEAAKRPPRRARHFRPEIPRAFESICDWCLQPEPSARYPSAQALAAELEHVATGRFRRAVRPPGKRRAAPRWVIGLAFAGAVAIGALVWQAHRRSQPASTTVPLKTEAKYFVDRALQILAREHSEPNLRSADKLMRQALTLDQNSALIHAEFSRILSKIYWHISPDEKVAGEAILEAQRALALDPRLAISHVAMADYNFRCRRDYSAALASLQKAAALDPKDGTVPALTALVLKRLNRWDEAFASSRRACELDPESAPRHYDLAATCDVLRRYREGVAAIQRARYLAPDNPAHTLLHAWLLFRANGDTSGLEQIVATLPFEQRMAPQYFDTVFLWLLWSQDHTEALRLAEALPDDYAVRRYDALLLKPVFVGLARRACADPNGSTKAFETARDILERRAREVPHDARVHGQLGLVYAYLSHTGDALREGQRAVDLLALSWEPLGGSYIAAQLAEIYAIAGETDKAVSLIDDLLARPGYLTVHELKVDPRWNPLRDNARFQQLVAAGSQN